MSRKGQRFTLAIDAALITMISGTVYAQDVSKVQLEEVLVTARKSEESQQTVPVSVTALSADALQRAAVLNVRDLQVAVPGLLVATNNQGGAPTFAIRAAKADNGTSDTVTAYLDDMPVASTRAVANMVYDMASISTLKGPQGTLFGANSTGGAIIFRPNKPSDVFEGYAEIGGGNYSRRQVQAMVNVPFNEVLQIRIAGEAVRRDGFVTNHTPVNGNSQMSNDKHESVRFSARLKPTSSLQNDLVMDYFHEDDQPNQEIQVVARGRYNYRTFLGFSVPVDYALARLQPTGDTRNVSLGPYPTWNKANILDVMNTTTYEVSDTAAFKNAIGYERVKLDSFQDGDASLASALGGRNTLDAKQWTLEPSLDISSSNKRFHNKTGLYFSDLKQDQGGAYQVIGLPWDTSALSAGQRGAVSAFYPIGSNSFYHREFRSRAVYTQFSYALSSELTATLGLRYTWDAGNYIASNRTAFGTASAAGVGNPFFGTCSVAALTIIGNFDPVACKAYKSLRSQAPSFTFTLDDKFADRSLIYATIRGGYIVGGFNNQANPAVTGIPFTFEPEKVVDFETGLKSDWDLLNRPIRTNVAVFYGNYRDQQRVQTGTTATGTTFVGVVNAGASNFYGLDLDITYQVLDNLQLSAAWNHIESEYTKFNAIVNIPGVFAYVDLAGQPMAQTPKDVVSLSATAGWPLASNIGSIKSTVNWFWRDKTVARDSPTFGGTTDASGLVVAVDPTQDFRAYDVLPAFDLWNFTTEWKAIMSSNLDANFWVKNLTDKKYKTYGSNQMLQFGYATYNYGNPREIGLNLRYNF